MKTSDTVNKHYTEQGMLIFGLCEGPPDDEEMQARATSGEFQRVGSFPCPNCNGRVYHVRDDYLWCSSCRTPTTWGIMENFTAFLEDEEEAEKLKYIHSKEAWM